MEKMGCRERKVNRENPGCPEILETEELKDNK
jgi:hypothetical protein